MKRVLSFFLCLGFFQILSAQGRVGINTTTPSAMLHVKDSSVLFTGPVTLPGSPGNTPVSGAGARMMWYPAKAAFRSGLVTGTQWDKVNIGQYSFASGYNTIAKGDYSISFGHTTLASGAQSTAFGSSTQATGTNTTSLGSGSISKGFNSTAIGVSTQSNGYASTVIGQWNDTIVAPQTTMTSTTPLFIIGKGDNSGSRSNALVVRKDGNIGIGISNPGILLNFPNTTGNKISLYGNSGAHFGFGIQSSLLQIYADNSVGDVAFGYGSSTAFTETMRIKGNGKVGIGTSIPAYPLNFANTVGDKISLWGTDVFHYGFGIQSGLLQIHTSAAGEDIAFGHGNSTTLTETMRIKGNGKVGIGTSSPGFPLNFANTFGDKISLWGNIGAHYGIGVQSTLFQIHSDVIDSDIAFGYGNSSSFTETMRVKGNGKVGIGTSTPAYPLNFANTVGDKISLWGTGTAHYGFGLQDFLLQIHGAGPNDDIAFGYGSSASFTEQMRIKGNGNVGIGTVTPGFPLNFSNALGDKISFWGNAGAHYGIGLQSTLLQIHSDIPDSDIAFGYGSSSAFTETMRITGDGKLGIGTNSPLRILHVKKGSSGATGNTSAVGLFENSTHAYLNIITPDASEAGLLFGNPTSSAHGGIIYNSSSTHGLKFRANSFDRMVINNTGKVGIGTINPITKLHVSTGNSGANPSSSDIATFESANDNAYINLSANTFKSTGIRFNHPDDSAAIYFNKGNLPDGLRFEVGSNSVAMTINEFGWVGIGTSIPQAQFDCNNAKILSLGVAADPSLTYDLYVGGTGFFSGTVTASCGVLTCSDKRYKTNIQSLTNSLTNVLSLRGVFYKWDRERFPDKDFNDQRQLGIIAQELEEIYPELVHTDEDGYKSVDYSRMTPVLLEAIKEQQVMINTQDEKINAQSELLKSQQGQIDFLMKELITLKQQAALVSREW